MTSKNYAEARPWRAPADYPEDSRCSGQQNLTIIFRDIPIKPCSSRLFVAFLSQ